MLPETVEVEPSDEAQGSIIWLHGLGADGHDFEAIVPELRLPSDLPIRFVFPHAPVRPVTINGGLAMRAWYDIVSLDRSGPQDVDGIRASGDALLALVEREHERGVPHHRIVVAGFSQGGAIATHTALRFESRLAGLMTLSSWLPLSDTIESEVAENPASQPRDMPVFIAHGTYDPMLSIDLGKQTRDVLTELGYAVEWREYPMQHAVCPEEIADIRAWLLGVFAYS